MDERLNNIIINEHGESLKYTPTNGGAGEEKYPTRISKSSHAQYLKEQFEVAWNQAEENRTAVSITARDGVYLHIKGQQGYDLLTKSLEDVRQQVRLLNVQEADDTISAIVYVPNRKQDFFIKKIEKYAEDDGAEVIGTIESIKLAMVDGIWVGNKESIPTKDSSIWCEVWLRYSKKDNPLNIKSEFSNLCDQLDIKIKHQHILFPERVVVGVFANKLQLTMLLENNSYIAEFRKMVVPNDFILDQEVDVQNDFIQDCLKRIDTKQMTDTSVCLVDTGVNNGHPLLCEILDDTDRHTVEVSRGVEDRAGHGTRMAGISAYFTLEDKFEGTDRIEIKHFLESSKLMDKATDNPEELYGELTAEAITLAEIARPTTNRAICMAVTSDTDIEKDGRPSSWSGAVDSIISGAEEENVKRLMFISAGNTTIPDIKESTDYITAISNNSVKDPGQAWNAITVGAFTERVVIEDDPAYKGYEPLAEFGGISPFTSSSITWDHSKWPIKPEIMLEGGNLAYSIDEEFYSETNDLSLLTTGHQPLKKPLDTISMTSSATAQASWMAAKLWSEYPNLWPETIRALLVHSAQWTEEMKNMINPEDDWRKKDYRNLLRTCGYGVPNLNKAIECTANSVNLIIQDELQPFSKKNGAVTLNEMHIHTLPWPTELLQQCENIPVKMKVTLSYYVEPGPGEIGWKDKYRYPSCGLSFDVNNPLESKDEFVKRISKAMRDDEEDTAQIKNDSSRWMLGTNNRNVGSIHSDIWEGTASQLADSGFVIIYPKVGWWKLRAYLGKYDSKIRYSIVITIETPEQDIDLYTAIQTEIKSKTAVRTEITAL